jgi:LCP family protein required for cell wall assembly
VKSSSWPLQFLVRFLIACVVVAVIAGVGVAVGDEGIKQQFASAHKIPVPNLQPLKSGEPANYLLIGSDSRDFVNSPGEAQAFGDKNVQTGKRSDVMMVLHIDPRSHTGLLVSFPRDTVVSIPGQQNKQLLNAAYSIGGPDLAVQTLQANFPPLKINHYIEVDFKGFQDIVDAVGNIHLWFPTPAHDYFSDLNQPNAGCISVNGTQALAYARSRYYSIPKNPANPAPWQPSQVHGTSPGWTTDPLSDLDRIPRQQYFLRTISQAAIDKTASNPTKLIGLLGAVSKSFTADKGLSLDEMKTLIRTFNGLNPKKVQMMTLPVTAAPAPWQGHVVATDAALAVAGQLMFSGKATPALPDPLAPSKVNVRIVNGTSNPALAQQAINDFTSAGFHVAGGAVDADRTDYKATQVRYAPGLYPQGYTVALAVGTLNFVPAISRANTLNSDVLVVVGSDYNSLKHGLGIKTPAPTTGTGATPTTGAAPTTVTTTTTTTVATSSSTVNPQFVPVDKNGGPLVGCPG